METLIIAFILIVVLLYLINMWKDAPEQRGEHVDAPSVRARRDSVSKGVGVSVEAPPPVRRVRWAKQAKRRDITPRGEIIDTTVPL